MNLRKWLAFPVVLLSLAAYADDASNQGSKNGPHHGPYNEAADAKADIKQALAQAVEGRQSVLVVFGANWCPDCKVLDLSLKQGDSAALVASSFKVVKVDVGRINKNLDIAEQYGVPLKKGIPAVAVLSSKSEVLYVTRSGELADARNMGDKGIYEFFEKSAASAKPK
jgi:thioredoxin 1